MKNQELPTLERTSTFLGIKFKVVPKGINGLFVPIWQIRAKSRLSVNWVLLEKILKPSKQSELDKNISLYNSMVMGICNYYCMATLIVIDFAEIAFKVTGKSNGMNP